jgi:protein O-GlcNAc transferase
MNCQSTRAAGDGDRPPPENPPPQIESGVVRSGIAEVLAAGLAHHQAGRLAEAEAHYRQVLAAAPDHADALHLLGGIAYQTGRYEVAIELIGRAIAHNRNDPSYHCTCGLVLQGLNRLDEAVASYDRALAISPDHPAALINRGLVLQALERFDEALQSYDRVLAIVPDYVEVLINRGNALQYLGRFTEALESYDRALALNPEYAAALNNRGNALQHLGRFAEALENYERALTLRPDYVEARVNHGNALQQLSRFAEAVESYDRALALRPDFVETLINRGNALRQLERFAEAMQSYDRVLANAPDYAEAWLNRGNTLQSLKRLDDAVASYDRALGLKPDMTEAWLDRGNTLRQLGRFDGAVESYERALALRPDYVEALINRGSALQQLGRFPEAVESYDRALALNPEYAAALNNRGNALQQLGRFPEALDNYERALTLRPDYVEARVNHGNALQQLGRLPEALESYDRALALRPENAAALLNRGLALRSEGKFDEAIASLRKAAALLEWFHTKQIICDWPGYREDETSARVAAKARVSRSAPFILLALSSSPEEQLDCARRVAAQIAARASVPLPPRQRRSSEKIRIGYLSADFRVQAVAMLIAGLIEHHDRGRFEVAGYSYGWDDHSALRSRLERGFDHFVDIGGMPNRQAAELIHAEDVDILVDLTGYTGDARTEILACRPAPIQVNYLGYPGTMGADFIDYIIVDRFVVPPDQQPFYSERLVHLPDCYQCSDDRRAIAERTPSRAECGLPETGFVFCCFNNSYKLTPSFFDIWMRLLAAVPGSVLWLADPWQAGASPAARANLAREAAARGIEPERLVFAPRVPVSEYLARLAVADLFLDTLPYNAGATANDALWAGLPVLTCIGKTYVGRMAGSLLRAIGLDELITTSLGEYEALALRLARDTQLLARLRGRLVQNRQSYPLFNPKLFARNLETAYWRMWEGWREGLPPAAFAVS